MSDASDDAGPFGIEARMAGLSIDIVSDVVCPWCFIGARRVELALAEAGIGDAVVTFHPFLLDPSTPAEGVDLRERLAKKYGVDPRTMFGRVEAAAKESGIPLDFAKVRRAVSTVKAHTLLRHALERGTQRALAMALFHAYFLEGSDIGEDEVLISLATAHGFDEPSARALLADERELSATREEAGSYADQGISGVPFTIVAGKLAVQGAQPVDVFRKVIERAASER